LQDVDLMITDGFIVTLDDEDHRFPTGAVAIRGSLIVGVGEAAELAREYRAASVLNADGKMIVPGFVNTHTHLFQTLLKGLGNTLPLHEWIRRVPAPMMAVMDDESLYLAAMVGCIDALRSGTTTLLDYVYPNPRHSAYDAILQALRDSGIRALLGRGVADIGSERQYPVEGYYPPLLEPLETALEHCEDLRQRCAASGDGRVGLCLAPPNMRTVSAEGLGALRDLAAQHGLLMTMHLCESPRDDETSSARYGRSCVDWLDDLDLLGPSFLAVHCVHLSDHAVRVFGDRGVSVSFNPVSNMYLGNGIPPIALLRDAGVRMALGSDGAAVNTNDLLETMKVGALLARVAARDPTSMTAEQALRMATIEGARALGMGEITGSIEMGKRADLLVLDLSGARSSPHHDPVAALVFSATSEIVRSVVVNGRILLDGGELVGIQEHDLIERAQAKASELVRTHWVAP
jgi:5-methylthioadenosine/S-adenosylhomocysteine deaminase